MNNIVLIGMPGAGKSTLGILLAKTICKEFIDTDILMQQKYKKLLHEIFQTDGIDEFIIKEAALIQSISVENTVIATGGSVILSNDAMIHLKSKGVCIYLKLEINTIIERINNIETRGIVKEATQSLFDIFRIRTPLYEYFSDVTIDCNNKSPERILSDVVIALK